MIRKIILAGLKQMGNLTCMAHIRFTEGKMGRQDKTSRQSATTGSGCLGFPFPALSQFPFQNRQLAKK